KWLFCFALSLFFLLLANLFRVVVLVLVYFLEAPIVIQEMIHVPLGILGFSFSSVLTYILLKYLASKNHLTSAIAKRSFNLNNLGTSSQSFTRFRLKQTLSLILFILVSIFIYQSKDYDQLQAAVEIAPTNQSLALTDKEKDLFLRHGVTSYQKKKITSGELSATIFLVKAKSWRGHHHPEQCLEGNGYSIKSSFSFYINPNQAIRLVELDSMGLRAAYWFVSQDKYTEDYASRVWEGLLNPGQSWVMVSVYFDQSFLPLREDFKPFIGQIQNQALAMLQGE
ncbi:MAG: hypothetical protein KDK66_09555, partial [Deltaproteobacteria bacterium]|nr:hypothetical protein [Deltaproteobacteria bacterium]